MSEEKPARPPGRDPMAAVEPALEQAIREGAFDDLPGKGKPLQLDPSPNAVVRNLLKEADAKPEWVELPIQIDALVDEAAGILKELARRQELVRNAAEVPPTSPPPAETLAQGSWFSFLRARNRAPVSA